jgi:hypothetical protein
MEQVDERHEQPNGVSKQPMTLTCGTLLLVMLVSLTNHYGKDLYGWCKYYLVVLGSGLVGEKGTVQATYFGKKVTMVE